MAWNEPGRDKDNDKSQEPTKENNPWVGNKKNQQGPPNLDEVLRNLHKKLRFSFAGKKDGDNPKQPVDGIFNIISIGFAILFAIWLISGIYIIGPAEQAVLLRFGKYSSTIDPGPHWLPRFIDQKMVENVKYIHTLNYAEQMLTEDTSIVDVKLSVTYRINNLREYYFNVVNPKGSLEQATASAVRQVFGHSKMDQVISSGAEGERGRQQIRDNIKKQLEETLKLYKSGLEIVDVNLQLVRPPAEVSEAFADAVKSREDMKREINKATAYAVGIKPKAEGDAAKIIEMAKAYQQQVVMQAQGDIEPFTALLQEYKRNPQVTRERLYLDSIQTVLAHNNKILLDAKDGNLLYLPLDKLMGKDNASATASKSDSNVTSSTVKAVPLLENKADISSNLDSQNNAPVSMRPAARPNYRQSTNANANKRVVMDTSADSDYEGE